MRRAILVILVLVVTLVGGQTKKKKGNPWWTDTTRWGSGSTSAVYRGPRDSSRSVPFRQGMTLGAGQSTTIEVTGPVITHDMYYALILGGFDDEHIYDSAVTTHQWTAHWYAEYERTVKKDPDMKEFYAWVRGKRIAEMKLAGLKIPVEPKLDTLVLTSGYNGVHRKVRFIFERKNRQMLQFKCQLAMIPYMGLNDQARHELDEARKYILSEEDIP